MPKTPPSQPTDVPCFGDLPKAFVETILGVHGEDGEAWLKQLPNLVEHCRTHWHLTLGSPFGLSYNYVVPATRIAANGQNENVVLKVGVPSAEFSNEMAALRHFDGQGAARLIDADGADGAMLLERLTPGLTLDRALPDDAAATAIAAGVMKQLWRPVPSLHVLPSLGDWFAGFDRHRARFGGLGPLPRVLFARAETLAANLLATSPEPKLLHGDLHHGNILTAGRYDFLAIDPKGVIGDPAFEPSAFLLNPHPVSAQTTARRLDIFSEALALHRDRIRHWGIARAILSAIWTIEENGRDFQSVISLANQLDKM